MELRFLKGNWEFGKYKLQYRTNMTPSAGSPFTEWRDVPTVEEPTVNQGWCPSCWGVEKPPEEKKQKKLWEKMSEYKHPHIPREGSYYTIMPGQASGLAEIAISAFKELIESITYKNTYGADYILAEELLKRLNDL